MGRSARAVVCLVWATLACANDDRGDTGAETGIDTEFGTGGGSTCESDADCQATAQTAGATRPEDASCGADGRCDLVGTGAGSFSCA